MNKPFHIEGTDNTEALFDVSIVKAVFREGRRLTIRLDRGDPPDIFIDMETLEGAARIVKDIRQAMEMPRC